jgi:hypothetical protein
MVPSGRRGCKRLLPTSAQEAVFEGTAEKSERSLPKYFKKEGKYAIIQNDSGILS